MGIFEKVRLYFNERIEYKRWELVKYALVSLCIFLPGLGRFFHYFTLSCLLCFVAFFCLCFGFLVLFRVKRKYLTPFIALGLLGFAYQLGIGKPFGYQMLTAIYETNHREMFGFLGTPMGIPLVLGGIAALAFVLWLIAGEKPLPFLHKQTFIRRKYLMPFLLLSALLFCVTRWEVCQTYPVCLFYNNFMYIDENIAIADYRDNPYECPREFRPNEQLGETYILVIGESARRLSLSSYGYERETSPELDKMLKDKPGNLALFSDAISTAAFTKASVMSIYSPLTVNEELSSLHTKPGLSKIFKGSGFSTLYVTTRPKYAIRNMLSTFLDDAQKTAYLTSLTKRKFDGEMLPLISDFIKDTPGKKFIIVHLMGSHFEYAAQYPGEFKYFHAGRKVIDAYDNSLRYTDHVLAELLREALQNKEPVCMLYVSDHGENLNDKNDGNYGHGTRELTVYELRVPFIVYFNDVFIAQHVSSCARVVANKEKPISHDNIAHTLMGLAGISDPAVYRSEFDISAAGFNPGPRFITDENMNPYEYESFDFSRKNRFAEIKESLAEKYRSKFTW